MTLFLLSPSPSIDSSSIIPTTITSSIPEGMVAAALAKCMVMENGPMPGTYVLYV